MNRNIIYINPIAERIAFQIYTPQAEEISYLDKNLETANLFPKKLVELVEQYSINEIWCVCWPGAFTLMRVITLSVNAISYSKNIIIKWCHFFELIKIENNAILELNSSEFLIRDSLWIRSVNQSWINPWDYIWYISSKISTEWVNYIQYEKNKDTIFYTFQDKKPDLRIVPIYFKPPNITWQKF